MTSRRKTGELIMIVIAVMKRGREGGMGGGLGEGGGGLGEGGGGG